MRQKSHRAGAALRAGLSFGIAFGLLAGVRAQSALAGVVTGLLTGLLFGLGIFAFAKVAGDTSALAPGGEPADFDPGETVLFDGPANHFKGLEGVGGWLFLTDRRLRFRSHKANIQVHDESYPLDEIASVEPVRTAWIIPNGLRVALKDGRRERFVVHSRGEWATQIERRLSGPRLSRGG